jgi:glycosyltransferase involved in cell wall biosynthesis
MKLKEDYKVSNVHFVGFKNKETLEKYYKSSDLFILPTRGDTWGLVINEAMAYGLPIITTDRCIAGTELVDDENGKIIPTESVEAIVEAVRTLINDEIKLKEMGQKSLEKIRWYTFESMAKVHIDFFENKITY